VVSVFEDEPGDVLHGARLAKRSGGGRGGNAERKSIFGRSSFKPGGQSREHRRVAEDFARTDEVEYHAIADDFDSSRSNNVNVLEGLDALRKDDLPGEVIFNLDAMTQFIE
jgi:hypothetical protein